MKYTVYDRLLRRELGGGGNQYSNIRGMYGDRQWIDDMDIINELDGHSGCVNALRYALPFNLVLFLLLIYDILVGLALVVCLLQAQTTTISISIPTNLIPLRRNSTSLLQS